MTRKPEAPPEKKGVRGDASTTVIIPEVVLSRSFVSACVQKLRRCEEEEEQPPPASNKVSEERQVVSGGREDRETTGAGNTSAGGRTRRAVARASRSRAL